MSLKTHGLSNESLSRGNSFSTSTIATDHEVISELIVNSKNQSDDEFNVIFNKAQEAISSGVYPELVPAGSSGSYFVYDINRKPIAIFKPKDEEPFAPLNPKWPKRLQRILCFCCFGRACLVPNFGYLSETGASLVDERLQLFLVPKTRVVQLCSPTFNHSGSRGQRPKEGSFQIFVHGYKSSGDVLSELTQKGDSGMTPEEAEKFTLLFQKLCLLDYAIRNTDRHEDNWLIRYETGEEISIVAIDNGLAFPVKHPESVSRFRTFPFHWSGLLWAKFPLNQELRKRILELLTPSFVHDLCKDLEHLFRHDKSHHRSLVHSQIRVLRGQLFNIREALEANEPPSEWVKRDRILVTRRYRHRPTSEDWNKCFKKKSADYSNRICC